MKNVDQFPEEIFDLFATKSYDELTHTERKMIQNFIDPEEYNDMAARVQEFSSINSSIDIHQSFEAPVQAQSPFAFLKKSIPLYQAAAAVLLCVLATYGLQNNRQPASDHGSISTVYSNEASVNPRDSQKFEKRLLDLKDVIQTQSKKVGTSLAQEDYPKELIFDL